VYTTRILIISLCSGSAGSDLKSWAPQEACGFDSHPRHWKQTTYSPTDFPSKPQKTLRCTCFVLVPKKSPAVLTKYLTKRGFRNASLRFCLLWRKIWANPVLQERENKFSRMEAWLWLVSFLATGLDDSGARLLRGEFRASARQLAGIWNWSPDLRLPFPQVA
jgi:hypothetical protein